MNHAISACRDIPRVSLNLYTDPFYAMNKKEKIADEKNFFLRAFFTAIMRASKRPKTVACL